MKYIYYSMFIIFSIMLYSCVEKSEKKLSSDLVQNPQTANGIDANNKLPVIQFKKTTHDFGELAEGERVSYSFSFKNTGGSDLIISGVSTSCGCTVADYQKGPIKPGDESFLEVVFDSQGERGYKSKSIIVVTNGQPNKTTLFIKAIVNRN